MPQVNVTYRAPRGDDKAVEAFGHTFFDGKQESIEVDDRVLAKLKGNPVFECSETSMKNEPQPGGDDPPPRDPPERKTRDK